MSKRLVSHSFPFKKQKVFASIYIFYTGSATWQAKRIKKMFHAKELIPLESELRQWSVLGNIDEMKTFLENIRENRLSDEEIVLRMKAASMLTNTMRIPQDTSPESDNLFYEIAENFFKERIAIRDLISNLVSKFPKWRKRKTRLVNDKVENCIPDEAYYMGR